MLPEKTEYRKMMMTIERGENGLPRLGFEPCRPLPRPDGWFETVWKEYRENRIHE